MGGLRVFLKLFSWKMESPPHTVSRLFVTCWKCRITSSKQYRATCCYCSRVGDTLFAFSTGMQIKHYREINSWLNTGDHHLSWQAYTDLCLSLALCGCSLISPVVSLPYRLWPSTFSIRSTWFLGGSLMSSKCSWKMMKKKTRLFLH